MDTEKAIDKALDDVPDNFESKSSLTVNRVGVKEMLLTEYNEIETMELFRQEGFVDGFKEGYEKGTGKSWEEGEIAGRVREIRAIMHKSYDTADKAMDIVGIPQEDRHLYKLLLSESSTFFEKIW